MRVKQRCLDASAHATNTRIFGKRFRLIEDVGLFNNAPNRNKKEVI